MAIFNTDKMIYQGEYPVIYITLKDIKVGSWVECFKALKYLLSDLFQSKIYIRESLNEIQTQNFNDVLMKSENADYSNALKDLSGYLENHYKKSNYFNINKFKKMYLSAVSYYDAGDSEKYYHHFMLGLLLTLGDKYVITSNRESGYGRYDIALEPKDKKNYGLIFEFKVGSENSIEEKGQGSIKNKKH